MIQIAINNVIKGAMRGIASLFFFRITESGDNRITENGDNRIIE
jgi:hypothetical protein